MGNVLTKTEEQTCLCAFFVHFDISELMMNSPQT